MNAPTIFIEHVSLAYANDLLFDDLSLTLPSGKCTVLLGASGVGKTTLLRLIANLTPIDNSFKGNIYCDNTIPLSQQIAYMAQTDLLLPWLTAWDNALLCGRLNGNITAELISKTKELFHQVGLSDALRKYPRELSGGMRQRVALVRTLVQNKPIVLMDEPFSAVDAITRFQLQTLAATLLRDRTVLLVTHDPIEALRLADEIYILSGQPVKLTAPLNLMTPTPRDPADSEFIQHQAQLFHALKEMSS